MPALPLLPPTDEPALATGMPAIPAPGSIGASLEQDEMLAERATEPRMKAPIERPARLARSITPWAITWAFPGPALIEQEFRRRVNTASEGANLARDFRR
jgi:hypothetical protein